MKKNMTWFKNYCRKARTEKKKYEIAIINSKTHKETRTIEPFEVHTKDTIIESIQRVNDTIHGAFQG